MILIGRRMAILPWLGVDKQYSNQNKLLCNEAHKIQECAMVIQRVTQSAISCSGESSGVVLWS